MANFLLFILFQVNEIARTLFKDGVPIDGEKVPLQQSPLMLLPDDNDYLRPGTFF